MKVVCCVVHTGKKGVSGLGEDLNIGKHFLSNSTNSVDPPDGTCHFLVSFCFPMHDFGGIKVSEVVSMIAQGCLEIFCNSKQFIFYS